jgi:flagellar biosynthetic protein FliQ
MTPDFAVELLKLLVMESVTLAAPFLGAAIAVGLAVSLFQAVTSIHEQTLTFVPKAMAVVGLLLVLMPWVVRSLMEFTASVLQNFPQMVK